MKRNKLGQFIKGSTVGNQFAKGNKPNKTSFKKGKNVGDKHPSWKGGLQYSERDGYIKWVGNKNRISLARYNYLKEYGEIPNGYVIYHLDGDKKNNNIDNLKAISRRELIKLNRNIMKTELKKVGDNYESSWILKNWYDKLSYLVGYVTVFIFAASFIIGFIKGVIEL